MVVDATGAQARPFLALTPAPDGGAERKAIAALTRHHSPEALRRYL